MRFWQSRNLVAATLWPLSQLFGFAVALRRAAYQWGWLNQQHIPAPVVVVGNITAGGSGKTPLVIGLVAVLQRAGYRPGVVSRGYGGKARRGPHWVTATSDPVQVGDEPVLIAGRCRCPVVVDRNRPRGALALVEHGCDVVLADDGLQHYALRRDVEIAVIDGRRGLGNGFLLPAGPLRERPSRLKRVDFVVGNGRADPGQYLMRLRLERAVNLLESGVCRRLTDWSGRTVAAVAGIGDPDRFFADLREHGLVVQGRAFADHHRFCSADLMTGDHRPLLMTEKDAVKCRSWARPEHWYVPAETELPETLVRALLKRLIAPIAPAVDRAVPAA